MVSTSSRTITVRRTVPPRAVTVRQRRWLFESSTSPASTSLPAETISTAGLPAPERPSFMSGVSQTHALAGKGPPATWRLY